MKFIKYIIGRFTIQLKNYIKNEAGQREYKGVEVIEGILQIAGPFVFQFFEWRFSNQVKIIMIVAKLFLLNDRLKVTTSNRKFLATPKFYVYNSNRLFWQDKIMHNILIWIGVNNRQGYEAPASTLS